ncbi:MAG: hypothetical protein IJ692_04380 [Alloprevotella sp.]|nr:hypothetical protein [Alloprevotella sp.]
MNLKRTCFYVESPNAEALRVLTEGGYTTSLYIANRSPRRLRTEQVDSILQAATRAWQTGWVKMGSCHVGWYDTVKKRLPKEMPLLMWDHRTTQTLFFLAPWKRAWLSDPQIRVILLKGKD